MDERIDFIDKRAMVIYGPCVVSSLTVLSLSHARSFDGGRVGKGSHVSVMHESTILSFVIKSVQ